jgi:hypothetical protein
MHGFYVAYEYGSGAAWAYVKADTPEEVVAELPEVDVYDTPPDWMTVEDLHRVREHASVDLHESSGIDEILQASRRFAAAVAS